MRALGGLVGAWLKVALDSRSSVKGAKSLTRIRGSAGRRHMELISVLSQPL